MGGCRSPMSAAVRGAPQPACSDPDCLRPRTLRRIDLHDNDCTLLLFRLLDRPWVDFLPGVGREAVIKPPRLADQVPIDNQVRLACETPLVVQRIEYNPTAISSKHEVKNLWIIVHAGNECAVVLRSPA